MNKYIQKVVAYIASPQFLWAIIGLFAFQAIWVAFSFRYPLPYDEGFHYGLIKVYSHHLSPIISNQPAVYDQWRDLFHEGSHLYHYFMSFPYRVIDIITGVQAYQVILLRLINIAFFASGLYLFNRLFRMINIRQIYINLGLLFLVLLPMTSLVGATINYDNLLFAMSAVFFIFTVRIIKAKTVKWEPYLWFVILGSLTSLIKSEFLVIFGTASIVVIVYTLFTFDISFFRKYILSITNASRPRVLAVTLLAAVSLALFAQIYAANILKYHTPIPDCSNTMQLKRCLNNSTFRGYYELYTTKNQRSVLSPNGYGILWLKTMERYSVWTMAITENGKPSLAGPYNYAYFYVSLATLVAISGILIKWKKFNKDRSFVLLMTVSIVLVLALFVQDILTYYKYHVPATIQTRYLFPILPIVFVYGAQAIGSITRKLSLTVSSFMLLYTIGVFLISGAGVTTHILLSKDNWYWQNQAVLELNHGAKKLLRPFVVSPVTNP